MNDMKIISSDDLFDVTARLSSCVGILRAIRGGMEVNSDAITEDALCGAADLLEDITDRLDETISAATNAQNTQAKTRELCKLAVKTVTTAHGGEAAASEAVGMMKAAHILGLDFNAGLEAMKKERTQE